MSESAAGVDRTQLKRALTLPLVVLYGLGVTIGAGIYVLIGAAAATAGMYAPLAFVLAAVVMAPSALSFAELSARFPVAAGEAAYVERGLGLRPLALLVGLLVIGVGVVSAAAISLGSVGYIRVFVDLPPAVLIPAVVLGMGAVAAWGISESVTLAATMTAIEIGGLMIIIVAAALGGEDVVARSPQLLPSLADLPALTGILGAALLAFFAFIGFESIVNVAEEVRDPTRTLPRAILWTLGTATLLYVLVSALSVLTVPPQELGGSEAPLALVFERATRLPPHVLSAIAIVATLNGIIVQMIMASRVIYGLAEQGSLPRLLAVVSPATRTPLLATWLVIAIVLATALFFPLGRLAETTSQISLVVYALVNLALIRIKLTGLHGAAPGIEVPMAVPVLGATSCIALLLTGLLL
jgi:amino acid transporter